MPIVAGITFGILSLGILKARWTLLFATGRGSALIMFTFVSLRGGRPCPSSASVTRRLCLWAFISTFVALALALVVARASGSVPSFGLRMRASPRTSISSGAFAFFQPLSAFSFLRTIWWLPIFVGTILFAN